MQALEISVLEGVLAMREQCNLRTPHTEGVSSEIGSVQAALHCFSHTSQRCAKTCSCRDRERRAESGARTSGRMLDVGGFLLHAAPAQAPTVFTVWDRCCIIAGR